MWAQEKKKKSEKFKKFINSAVYHIEKIEKAQMVKR